MAVKYILEPRFPSFADVSIVTQLRVLFLSGESSTPNVHVNESWRMARVVSRKRITFTLQYVRQS